MRKRGGARTLVARQHPAAIVFLVGRRKREPGADFSDLVVQAAKMIAVDLQRQPVEKLIELAAKGELKEIGNAEEGN